ncbi:sarcospan [Anoplopoma fimbria]|uniref:sarcospan n=1 Tax=Anoplopoma fimbria TaxID=229290 RepID=UPI0023EC8EC2|nr:sarcospan [Anoplopoma fimbria]
MARGGLGREGKGRRDRQTDRQQGRLILPKHCNSKSREYREEKKSVKKSGEMGQGQKGSSDKKEGKKKKKRDESSAPEDGQKCRACRFPLLVALLQLLLGVAVAVVAFLMLAMSPSLLARETPHWAGIILCLVSILGFILYCITYIPDERTSTQFIGKILYFVLCTIGLVISVLALSFAGHHYSQTSGFSCEPVGEDCVCKLDPNDPIARTFTYEGVSDCEGITGTLPLYFLLQIVLNLAQAIVCAIGAFIMWKHRYQVFFAGLQVGSPSSQQWQKV